MHQVKEEKVDSFSNIIEEILICHNMAEEKKRTYKIIKLRIRSFGMVQDAHIETCKPKISNSDICKNSQIFKYDVDNQDYKWQRFRTLRHHWTCIILHNSDTTTTTTDIAKSKRGVSRNLQLKYFLLIKN